MWEGLLSIFRGKQRHVMRILFLGDIVGKPGYTAVVQHAAALRTELKLDALVVNAENASDGSGLMPRQFKRLTDAGVDVVTLGDHIYRCKEIIATLKKTNRMVKPANYPADAAGKTWAVVDTAKGPLGVISLMGRVYMRRLIARSTRAIARLRKLATRRNTSWSMFTPRPPATNR